jgi:hypothetical protein
MKLLGFFIGASLALNLYVLWRLDEQSWALTAALHKLEVSQPAQRPTVFEEANKEEEEAIAFLKMEVTELSSRLQAMEQAYGVLEADEEVISSTPEQYSNTESLIDSIQSASHSGTDEEWFWSQRSTDDDISMSFQPAQGFAVNSVVCRSDWCRVEVEDTSNETNDLIAGLELQLRINESLGRNTVIQTGERNGRHRVLFIQ